MTSSLVGSEMCIRDRAKGHLLPGGPGRVPALPLHYLPDAAQCFFVFFLSVSYTHLTLPTICSV
eukprot:8422228-Prorocentrum_lima.AAC.1